MVSSTRLRSTHCRLRAFAVDNGVDGAFRLSQETAFSRRFPGREHAIRLLDAVTGADVTRWTPRGRRTNASLPTKRT